MASSSPLYRGFQVYNSNSSRTRPPSITTKSMKFNEEGSTVTGVPYTSFRTSISARPPSVSSSPSSGIRSSMLSSKRRSSTAFIRNLLSQRKSLQTTAIATRRQSLWLNLAKSDSLATDFQMSLSSIGQQQKSLLRKKILRLLLVFSYLVSISLLAIALATFYGFFWSGYSTSEQTNSLDMTTNVSLMSNSTNVNDETDIEHELLINSSS